MRFKNFFYKKIVLFYTLFLKIKLEKKKKLPIFVLYIIYFFILIKNNNNKN